EDKKLGDPSEMLKQENHNNWFRELQHINFNVHQGSKIVESVLNIAAKNAAESGYEDVEGVKENLLKVYGSFAKGKPDEVLNSLTPPERKFVEESRLTELTHGDIYLRESYGFFQNA